MKDVKNDFSKRICIFCYYNSFCDKSCITKRKTKDNVKIFKCNEYRRLIMDKRFKDYIKYIFVDETNKNVAIVSEQTPEKILVEIKKVYDIVKFDE